MHERMVELVERVLRLDEKHSGSEDKPGKDCLQRQIEATAQEIEQLVYKLYELTDAEAMILSRARCTSKEQRTT